MPSASHTPIQSIRPLQKTWCSHLACLGPFGLAPVAPGTIGSLVAIPFAACLIANLSLASLGLVCLLWILLAIWCCGRAELELGLRDPGCIILDEFVAVPCCYLGLLALHPNLFQAMKSPEGIFSSSAWILHGLVFALFRLFDITKPWPVGPAQRLPGGWGVVLDDVVAAILVNIVLMIGWWGKNHFPLFA